MRIETYVVTVRHDNGKTRIRVVSLSGKQGAITQVVTAEGCPECAIVGIRRLNKKR